MSVQTQSCHWFELWDTIFLSCHSYAVELRHIKEAPAVPPLLLHLHLDICSCNLLLGAPPRDQWFQRKEQVQGNQEITLPLHHIPVEYTVTNRTVTVRTSTALQPVFGSYVRLLTIRRLGQHTPVGSPFHSNRKPISTEVTSEFELISSPKKQTHAALYNYF